MQFGCQTVDITTLLATFLSLILPVSFYSNYINNDKNNDGGNDGKCELIGTFSLFTQAFLGFLCLSSLIVKRFYEYPLRRTWPVWSFDVSKQLIGALGVHIFNVLLSILKTSGNDFALDVNDDDDVSDDPCDWYFLNIVLDCTIGVYVLYLVFKAVNKVSRDYLHFTQIESGQYGPDPHKPSFRAFMKQLFVYFSSLMITKFILYGFVECFEAQLLWTTSHILLIWLDEYPDEFEIFVVMFVVPIFMNCLQLVLIDNFIQNQVMHNFNIRMHQHPSENTTNGITSPESVNDKRKMSRHNTDSTDTSSATTEPGDDINTKNYGTFNEA